MSNGVYTYNGYTRLFISLFIYLKVIQTPTTPSFLWRTQTHPSSIRLIFSSTRFVRYVRSCSQGCAFALVWPYRTLAPISRNSHFQTHPQALVTLRVTQQVAIELFTLPHHCLSSSFKPIAVLVNASRHRTRTVSLESLLFQQKH